MLKKQNQLRGNQLKQNDETRRLKVTVKNLEKELDVRESTIKDLKKQLLTKTHKENQDLKNANEKQR